MRARRAQANSLKNTTEDTIASRILEPGMDVSIEPGIYFMENGPEEARKL